MTEKEVCLMCENYSEDTKCDQKDSCKLMAVLKENRALKKKISKLQHQWAGVFISQIWRLKS